MYYLRPVPELKTVRRFGVDLVRQHVCRSNRFDANFFFFSGMLPTFWARRFATLYFAVSIFFRHHENISVFD